MAFSGVLLYIFFVGGLFPRKGTASVINVRLFGDYIRSSYGLVEVQFNGTWGTWCSAPWNLNNAHVTCRHLGFDGAAALVPESYPSYDGGRVKWRNDLHCFGNETSLTDCPQTGFISVRYCSFRYKASNVMCNLQVRLAGGVSNKQGFVQVYYNNNWNWVCGEQWKKQDANVTCNWLGYSGPSEAYTDTARDGANGTTWISNVNCTGDELSLFSCVHGGWFNRSCVSNQIAGVRCTGPEGGELTSYQGQVEVLFNGVWAGICYDYDWDFPEANVVCRQLGYHGAAQPTYHERFQTG
ncbi:scavenger receptor cysteine-rich domain superfamily protein-like isoform X2 [Stylophora pistillata]|uniref:scavenger receptor cysteine-rich domain superfamily protein-like isoform X2 n=1 Tax=Stylophora pistillata TaxID=50429 RepID=UPI000C03CF40|nr:scavenger receptor cysteine-rich domain superfamily protein-like isoform X2 [Stylophora pistillata]